MKRILFFSFIILPLFSLSQIVVETTHHSMNREGACNPEEIFVIVEQPPVFKGGDSLFYLTLNKFLNLPPDVNGVAYVDFIINCDGLCSGFTVLKGIDPGLDQKLIESMASIDGWIPGKQNGKNVDCNLNIAVRIENGIVLH